MPLDLRHARQRNRVLDDALLEIADQDFNPQVPASSDRNAQIADPPSAGIRSRSPFAPARVAFMRMGSMPAAGLASTSVTSLAASGWNAPSSTSTLACGLR